MITTSEFRNGLKLELDGEPFVIVEFQHVKPGKGGAFVRTKLKSLTTGNVIDKTFRSGERFDEAPVEEREMQFLYAQGEQYHFMDVHSFEQLFVPRDRIGEALDLLKENIQVRILFYRGKAIAVELPVFVELRITDTAPAAKGDTAAGGTKPATLETGAVVKVPFHIQPGEVIRIDTRTRSYVERVK